MLTQAGTLEHSPTGNWQEVQTWLTQFTGEMHRLEKELRDKFKQLDDLNHKFKLHQEESFYRVFMEIMDRLTNELGMARQKYDNIDKELERDDMVAKLNRELYFFRQECLFQSQQNQKLKEQISVLKAQNDVLSQEKQEMRSVMFKKRLHETSSKLSRHYEYSVPPMSPMLGSSQSRYSRILPTSATTVNPEQWIQMRNSSFNKSSLSRSSPVDRISEALTKLQSGDLPIDSDTKKFTLVERLDDFQRSIQRIKCKMGKPEIGNHITTKSTDKDSPKNFKEVPLRYSSRSKRIKRTLPMLINDSEPSYYG